MSKHLTPTCVTSFTVHFPDYEKQPGKLSRKGANEGSLLQLFDVSDVFISPNEKDVKQADADSRHSHKV
ncbi:MAG: hypothetical protein R3354_07220 [Thiohalomonadales bacterium]|nr:hypothetical protein [Thiohalomonadales bacterium]